MSPEEGRPGYDLGREGGHSQRRVLHAADFTGQEIERVLVERCEAHPNIQLVANSIAVDLPLHNKSRKHHRQRQRRILQDGHESNERQPGDTQQHFRGEVTSKYLQNEFHDSPKT